MGWQIWVQIAIAVISIAITILVRKGSANQEERSQSFTDDSIPQEEEGTPIGILMGTRLIRSPNINWYGNAISDNSLYRGHTRYEHLYRHFIDFQMTFCMGVANMTRIFAGEKLVMNDRIVGGSRAVTYETGTSGPGETVIRGTSRRITTGRINQNYRNNFYCGDSRGGRLSFTMYFYGGTQNQSSHSFLNAQTNSQIRYLGRSYAIFRWFECGESPQIPRLSFEMESFPEGLPLSPIGADANPANMIWTIFNSASKGRGVSNALLDRDSFLVAGERLRRERLGASIFVNRNIATKEVVLDLLNHCEGDLVENYETKKLHFRLIRNDYNINNLPVLDESNIIRASRVQEDTPDNTINAVRVRYENRQKNYKDSMAFASNPTAGNTATGSLRAEVLDFRSTCCEPRVAQDIVEREEQIRSAKRYRTELEVHSDVVNLFKERNQFFGVTGVAKWIWPDEGIKQAIMRITKIRKGTLTNSSIILDVVEDRFALRHRVLSAEGDPQFIEQQKAPTAIREGDVTLFEAPRHFGIELIQSGENNSVASFDSAFVFHGVRCVNPNTEEFIPRFRDTSSSSSRFFTESEFRQCTDNGVLNQDILITDDVTTIIVDNLNMDTETINYYKQFPTLSQEAYRLCERTIKIGEEMFAFTDIAFANDDTRAILSVGQGVGALSDNKLGRAMHDTVREGHSLGDQVLFISGRPPRGSYGTTPFSGDEPLEIRYDADNAFGTTEGAIVGIQLNQRAIRPIPPKQLRINSNPPSSAVVNSNTFTLSFKRRPMENVGFDGPEVYFENDNDATPESGTTYHLRWTRNGVAQPNEINLGSSAQGNVTLPGAIVTDIIEIEVFSRRNNLDSLFSSRAVFTISSP